MVINPTNQGY